MKKIVVALVSSLALFIYPLSAQPIQGGEYINSCWINLIWASTLTSSPVLTNFQIGYAYQFDVGINGVIFHNPSGKQLSTPAPQQLILDLMLAPCNSQTVTFTDSQTNQSVTISGAGIVQALGAFALANRNGAAMQAQAGEP
jgi:hypothetical protein